MPKTLALAYDNCGENKCKTNFGYLSLLVELGIFLTIFINFLIVGHTHNPLDQYYSVLSTARFLTCWIGSQGALQSVFQFAHSNPLQQPKYQHVILVEFKYDEWLAPYLANYKHYQTPYCFVIKVFSLFVP